MSEWTLIVEFAPPQAQAIDNPEYAFPNDHMSRFVHYISELWALDPEDLRDPEVCVWNGDKITLYAELIDQIVEPLEWLTMSSIPESITVLRGRAH